MRTLLPNDSSQRYVDWLNSGVVNQFLEARHKLHTLLSLQEFLTSTVKSSDSIILGVFLSKTSQHIGNVKVSKIDFVSGSGEIGYLIGEPSFWGKGYATEAIMAVSAFSFTTLGLSKLTAGAYSSNTGSIRVLEKSGFERVTAAGYSGSSELPIEREITRFLLKRDGNSDFLV